MQEEQVQSIPQDTQEIKKQLRKHMKVELTLCILLDELLDLLGRFDTSD